MGLILTLATAFSLIRVFEGDSWVLPVFIAAGVSHLLALAVRLAGRGMVISSAVSGVGLVLAVTWTHYWDTAVWALPTGDTWTALADDWEGAWSAFGDLSPPIAPIDGFTVSAVVAVWLLAFLNDAAAMRVQGLFEPLMLPVVAIGFVGLVGDDQHRILTIGIFTAVLLLFATVHRIAARTTGTNWLGDKSRASAGRRALLAGGASMAVVALAGAMAAGPVLGSHDDPLVDLTETIERASRRSPGRVVISPLVDIRGRLVNQAEAVMFRVRADQRSYWRLTALDQFDGQVWTSRADYAAQPTQLPSLFQSGSSVQESTQQFRIERLGAVWLPAAFEPRSLTSDNVDVDLGNGDISYEPSSSTLIVGRSLANSNGIAYTVTSALPRFDPEVLEGIPLGAETSPELVSYTELPPDFSPRVRALAADLTAGAGSAYGQALALQDFFRNGNFVYDAYASPGHSGNRIEEFLDSGRGYCEQFAGTFAAMARSLGLPARVAVGFTVGEPVADEAADGDPDLFGDLYVVRGKHAHAWPEVYLAGVGWVAFEPTPGRGAPGAQNYTGVAESQATSGPGPEPIAEDSINASVGAFDPQIDFESLAAAELADADDGQTSAPAGQGGMTWRAWAGILGPVLAVLLILLIPWFKHLRRQRRYRKMAGNRGKIRLLWSETIESLSLIDMTPRPHETQAEFARRAIAQVPLHSADLRQLGELAAAATFAPTDPTDRHQWLARTWSTSVRSEVDFRVGRGRKLAAAFNPRPLFGGAATRSLSARRRRAAGG